MPQKKKQVQGRRAYLKARVPPCDDVVRPLFDESKFGQRGSTQADQLTMLYQPRMSGSSTGAVTTKKELSIKVTDFFDYVVYDATAGAVPQDVTHYSWNVNQNLFNNAPSVPGDLTTSFCRVRDVSVWVLPVKGFDTSGTATNNNNADGMYTVNCQTPGSASAVVNPVTLTQLALATDTQVTNVLPQIDTMWKKVFHCNLQKTFQSGVIRPYFRTGGSVGTGTTQCLFSMSVTDPVDGKSYLPATADETLKIRVKVQLTIDQPISTFQQASLSVFKNEDFTLPFIEQNGTPYPGVVDSYVQMDLKGARDNMR
jgi:hypothetical protein